MRVHWKNRAIAVSGNALEFYDIAVFGALSVYVLDMFSAQHVNHPLLVVWGIFALRFLLRPLGGYVLSQFAESKGRKSALILASFLTGTATLSMALVPVDTVGVYIVAVFLIFQLVQAFAFGGEYTTLMMYLMTDSKANERSRVGGMLVSSSLVGVLFALVLVLALESALSTEEMRAWGWRIPLMLGCLNILFCLVYRLKLSDQKVAKVKMKKAAFTKLVTQLFLISIVAAVVFYVQNMSSRIIGNALNISNLGIINISFLLLSLFLVSCITDKFFNARAILKAGVIALIALSIPLYAGLQSDSIIAVSGSMVIFTLLAAMVLCNFSVVLWEVSQNNLMAVSMGYNISLSIFGGLTPLIITGLIPHGFAFAGGYIALAAAISLMPLMIPTSTPHAVPNSV